VSFAQVPKLGQALGQLLPSEEVSHPLQLGFEGVKETFDAANDWRLTDNGGGGLDVREPDLTLKVGALEPGAVILEQPHRARDGFCEAAEALVHGLAGSVQSREPVASLGHGEGSDTPRCTDPPWQKWQLDHLGRDAGGGTRRQTLG